MKNPFTFKHLLTSPVTSLAGILLMSAGMATTLSFGIPWSESIVPVALGLLLMLSPDTVISYLKGFLKKEKVEDNKEE